MKNIKKLIISSLALFLVSCSEEAVVDIPTHDESGKIVIEGNATDNGDPCIVRVTRSIKVSDIKNEYAPIANAVVVINDDEGHSETLRYIDGVYKTVNFTTKHGDIYTLTVTADGVTYKAVSQMPQYVKLENLKQTPFFNGVDNVIGVIPVFTDPQTQGDHYLFKSYVNNGSAKYTVFDDNDENGTVNTSPIGTKTYPQTNDKVTVVMEMVDTAVYNYFKVLQNVSADNGDVLVTPSNPPSNFNNGALGYFSAHTTSVKSIVIQ